MKYVEIDSTIPITVTHTLKGVDKTNYESKTGNNLNVKPTWFKTAVQLKQGRHVYPAELAEWPTVKALHDSHKITIGRETDTLPEEDREIVEKFESAKAEVAAEEKAVAKAAKKITDIKG